MPHLQRFDLSPSLSNWKRSFWSVCALVTFGVATLADSLLGTLSVVLLTAPIYAFCSAATFLVWRRSLPHARLHDALAVSLRGGIAVLWRSVVLFMPVLVVAYFQLHVIKAFEVPGTAVFAWPKSAPSVVLITVLWLYVPLAVYLAARSSATRVWERLTRAAPELTPSNGARLRLSIIMLAVFAAFASASTVTEGTGWQGLVWPIQGIRGVIEKTARLWVHYDTSRPWRVGATYVFGEEWRPRIIKSGMELNYYNTVELVPSARRTPQAPLFDISGEGAPILSKIDAIVIHSGTFGSIQLVKRPTSGEFSCARSSYDLIRCQLASAAPQMPLATSQTYLADLISERRFDRDTERTMDPKKQHEIERKGFYVLNAGAEPSFFAHCESGVCTAFSVYGTDDGQSGIQVVFSEQDLAQWQAIAVASEALLFRLHDRARAFVKHDIRNSANQ